MKRTRTMVAREQGLSLDQVETGSNLRDELLMEDDDIANLEVPIEERDFDDVKAQVAPSRLKRAKTITGLRGAIWRGIPQANRKK